MQANDNERGASDADFEHAKFAYKTRIDNFRRLLAKKQTMFFELLSSVQ